MKYRYLVVALSLSLIGGASCKDGADLLDPVETNEKNSETVFRDSITTMQFLNNIYKDIAFNWEYKRYTNTSTGNTDASDDGVSNTENAGYLKPLADGTLSAALESPYTTSWSTPYTNIRKVNVFLHHVDRTNMKPQTVRRIKAEARFLRAWYYTSLVKYFGGIILLYDELVDPEEIFTQKRASYEECVNYIVSELDLAATDLPLNYNDRPNEHGRVTKGAALALKARVLLYAASPLFNGGNIGQEMGGNADQIGFAGYSNYDKNRWIKAQQAALDVMNLNQYELYEDPNAATEAPGYSFSRVFLKRKNSEYIFQFNLPANKEMESYFGPQSRGGTRRSMPTHNLAQAFGMINGKGINEVGSGYDPDYPFKNRDPRFNYTITYNGTSWLFSSTGMKLPVYTYVGANLDGFSSTGQGVHTGYFWRKMQDDGVNNVAGGNTERCIPIIRYAEILMMYAESSNELGETSKAYDMIKLLRERAGIVQGTDGLYGLKSNMDITAMREAIYNEKRVEFAYEDQRFWDVRRWKIAESLYNGLQLTANRITQKAANNFTDFNYQTVPINHAQSKLKFNKQNYLFPVGQSEINKNRAIVQSVGY